MNEHETILVTEAWLRFSVILPFESLNGAAGNPASQRGIIRRVEHADCTCFKPGMRGVVGGNLLVLHVRRVPIRDAERSVKDYPARANLRRGVREDIAAIVVPPF